MCTRLYVADIEFPYSPVPLKSSIAKIVKEQDKSEAYPDQKCGVRELHFQPRSLIRTKKPGLLKREQSKFPNSLRVACQQGPYIHELRETYGLPVILLGRTFKNII